MRKQTVKSGFTIVELLTVMSVIAILIGLLVPSLNLVRRLAKDTNQKAQFHAIDVALEIYNGEMDGYPDSNEVMNGSGDTVGAMHLCEAVIGRDRLGYDPASTGDAADDAGEDSIYADKDADDDLITASLQRRKGPYLSAENVEAYELDQLYPSGTENVYPGYDGTSGSAPAPVLTDSYKVKDVVLSNNKRQRAGSPILYYKANTSVTGLDIFPDPNTTIGNESVTKTYIYDVYDNEELVKLGHVKEGTANGHHIEDGVPFGGVEGWRNFYDRITNPNITSQSRPYNPDTYLLISAGYDGLYGTDDDVTNFGN